MKPLHSRVFVFLTLTAGLRSVLHHGNWTQTGAPAQAREVTDASP